MPSNFTSPILVSAIKVFPLSFKSKATMYEAICPRSSSDLRATTNPSPEFGMNLKLEKPLVKCFGPRFSIRTELKNSSDLKRTLVALRSSSSSV